MNIRVLLPRNLRETLLNAGQSDVPEEIEIDLREVGFQAGFQRFGSLTMLERAIVIMGEVPQPLDLDRRDELLASLADGRLAPMSLLTEDVLPHWLAQRFAFRQSWRHAPKTTRARVREWLARYPLPEVVRNDLMRVAGELLDVQVNLEDEPALRARGERAIHAAAWWLRYCIMFFVDPYEQLAD